MSSSSEASRARARSHTASAEEVEGASVRGTRTEPRVSKPEAGRPRAGGRAGVATPELRVGNWTRLGGSAVLGDAVTESMLDGLATKAQEAARAQGYAVGWAEGRRAAAERAAAEEATRAAHHAAAEERREAEHRAAVDALGRAAEQVRGLLGDLAAAIEEQASDLAFALTTEILGALVALIDWHVEFALNNRPLIVVQDRDWASLPEDARERVRALQRRYVDLWADRLREADPDLGPAEARARAHACFGLINSTPHSARLPEPEMRAMLAGMATRALGVVTPTG